MSVEGVEPEILDAHAFAQLARQEWNEMQLHARTRTDFERRERVGALVRATAQALDRLLSMVDLGALRPPQRSAAVRPARQRRAKP